MKKIIGGKLYNTDTARLVGEWSNAGDWRDFGHMEEALYQKKTGEFFLHGEGGPASKYAEQTRQNAWTGGEKIIPLSYETARQWAEDHLTAEQYERAFGEVAEDEGRSTLLLSLSTSTIKKIKQEAAQAGLTVSAYIESKL